MADYENILQWSYNRLSEERSIEEYNKQDLLIVTLESIVILYIGNESVQLYKLPEDDDLTTRIFDAVDPVTETIGPPSEFVSSVHITPTDNSLSEANFDVTYVENISHPPVGKMLTSLVEERLLHNKKDSIEVLELSQIAPNVYHKGCPQLKIETFKSRTQSHTPPELSPVPDTLNRTFHMYLQHHISSQFEDPSPLSINWETISVYLVEEFTVESRYSVEFTSDYL